MVELNMKSELLAGATRIVQRDPRVQSASVITDYLGRRRELVRIVIVAQLLTDGHYLGGDLEFIAHAECGGLALTEIPNGAGASCFKVKPHRFQVPIEQQEAKRNLFQHVFIMRQSHSGLFE